MITAITRKKQLLVANSKTIDLCDEVDKRLMVHHLNILHCLCFLNSGFILLHVMVINLLGLLSIHL